MARLVGSASKSRVACGLSAIVVVLAMLALTPLPAGATSKVLELTWGGEGQFAPGMRFVLDSSSATTFEMSHSGTVACGGPGAAWFNGEDVTNKEATDSWSLTSAAGEFREGHCASTLALGKPTVEFFLPELRLSDKLKAEFKPTSSVIINLTLYFPSSGVVCEYSASKLKAKMTLPNISVSLTRARLKLTPASPKFCPKTAAATVSFIATTADEKYRIEGRVLG